MVSLCSMLLQEDEHISLFVLFFPPLPGVELCPSEVRAVIQQVNKISVVRSNENNKRTEHLLCNTHVGHL